MIDRDEADKRAIVEHAKRQDRATMFEELVFTANNARIALRDYVSQLEAQGMALGFGHAVIQALDETLAKAEKLK